MYVTPFSVVTLQKPWCLAEGGGVSGGKPRFSCLRGSRLGSFCMDAAVWRCADDCLLVILEFRAGCTSFSVCILFGCLRRHRSERQSRIVAQVWRCRRSLPTRRGGASACWRRSSDAMYMYMVLDAYPHVCMREDMYICMHIYSGTFVRRDPGHLRCLGGKFPMVAKRAKCHSCHSWNCLLYTSPSPRDATLSRMPSSA